MKYLYATKPKLQSTPQAGFTIVELMIATLVFSIVLLVITTGVLHFTNDYYKGINSSTTQTATQNAIDTISQAVQFSGGGTTSTDGTEGYFCAGSKVFVYTLGQQYNGDPTATTGLYEMDQAAGGCAARSPAGGTELLGKSMRLTDIQVSAPADPDYTSQISLRIVYGDYDLLCDTAISSGNTGSCASNNPYGATTAITGNTITCRGQTGSQFCSVAALSTVAEQRIQ